MTARDGEELEQLILSRERLRAQGDPRAVEYDGRISVLATRLGLSEEELREVTAHLSTERAPAGSVPLRGSYRISRPGRFIPLYIGAVLAILLGALGARSAASGLLVALAAFYLFRKKRVTSFVIDEAGGLRLGSEASTPLDWQAVTRIEVEFQAPRWGTEITRAARERLRVQIQTADGRRHRFARGMLFQLSPVRRPVHHVHLERYLRACAEEGGMSVTRFERGFDAVRS